MLFNSFEFLIFLPVVFVIHWAMGRGERSQNAILLLASWVFYTCWDARFLLLLVGITAVGYGAGRLLAHRAMSQTVRRVVLWSALVINLGVLGAFKYFDFFASSFAGLLRAFGLEADSVTLGLVLPVGISFFTFQTMGYIIDVYRRTIEPTADFVKFAVFISFFPQLVAGPIERATNLLPQFSRIRRFDPAMGTQGLRLILWGLFKKVVVADNCAPFVAQTFDSYATLGSAQLWIGAVLFAFQIYGDFSGYSDIARGTGRMFGINLMHNFRTPYFSRSVAEFWRRWHISLNTWFVDYLYIPLGGSRRGKVKTARNTMAIFLTSGLWHGANLTFVGWGAFHAFMFLPLILTGNNKPTQRQRPWLADTFLMGLTFIIVVIGWVLFRAPTISDALHYIGGMIVWHGPLAVTGIVPLVWIALLLAAEWLTRGYDTPFDTPAHGLWRHRVVRWFCYLIVVAVVAVFGGQQQQFIYFQF